MKSNAILFVLLLIGIFFLIVWLRRKFKVLNLPCVFFVSGEVKSGKSLLSAHLAIKEYKRAMFRWHLRNVLYFIFKHKCYRYNLKPILSMLKRKDFDYSSIKDLDLKDYLPPMLYSNIDLACVKYNRLTIDIIERNVRIPNKSVCLIDEVSLFADSQLFNRKDINNKLMAFYKLYGHYSHGGKLIVDSQAISDNHYSMKRCMSKYLYIYSRVKLPFITVMNVRELIYSDDNSIQNNFNEDLELSMRKVLVWNKTYDKYDCYCYSCFTDYKDLNVVYQVPKKSIKDDLKCYHIVSLNEFVNDLNKEILGKYPNTAKCVNDKLYDGDYYFDEEGVLKVYKKVINNENS